MRDEQRAKQPLYRQIANLLRASLIEDAQKPPRLLPREVDLAKSYGVARSTIRGAMEVLQREGLIQRTPGYGTVTVPEGILAWNRTRHTRRIIIHSGQRGLPERPVHYIGQIYQGILATAEQAGYACSLREELGRFPSMVGAIPEDPKEVLGVILIQIMAEPIIAMHLQTGLPVVCVDHTPVNPSADVVVTDCFTEGRQAVEFLLRNGHRELFFVGRAARCTPVRDVFQPETDAVQMEAGYRLACRLAGLDASADRTIFVHYDHAERGELASWLVAQAPSPTAGVIFDPNTFGLLLKSLRERKIRCPEDISLITKTNINEPKKACALYTDAYRLGDLAVQTLLARAAGLQPPGLRTAIASELRRGSTVRMISH